MLLTRLMLPLVLGGLTTLPSEAQDVAVGSIVTGGPTMIVYVFPTSPQSFVPVAGLPSFLVMPGGDVPAGRDFRVIYTSPGPLPSTLVASAALDCRNFTGVVTIAGPDAFNLDKDHDGIGCEPEDR